MTQPNSDRTMSAAKRTLSLESLRAMGHSGAAGRARQRGEMLSAVFEIPELIERSAGGGKENRVTGTGELVRTGDRPGHRPASLGGDDTGESPLDGGRG